MAEINNKYTRGKIYKIVSDKSENIYIGSTTEPTLARRMAGHRANFKDWKNGKRAYVTSYSLLEHGDAQIILIELCSCKSKDELLSRERHYIEMYKNNVVNKQVRPIITKDENEKRKKEYYDINKKKICEYQKEYRKTNFEIVKEKKKEYIALNMDIFEERQLKYREKHREYLRNKAIEYREKNAELIKMRAKNRYNANKETINNKNKEYRNANKEKYISQRHVNYNANKEKINLQRRYDRISNKVKIIKAKIQTILNLTL